MTQLYITVELFKTTQDIVPQTGGSKCIILNDDVNTTDLLVSEIKNQSMITGTVIDKIFVNDKEVAGEINLTEVKGAIRYAGYKKNRPERFALKTEEVTKSKFDSTGAKQFLADKKK